MTFPEEAMEFYRDLADNNSREFWLANKERYDRHVKGPIAEVAGLLADEFGEAKVFRPNRDVRFSANKAPYKTHQGAYVETGPASGFYFEVNAEDAPAGGGFYRASSEGLARFRKGIDDDAPGAQLERIVSSLEGSGWLIGGDSVATAPRGYKASHPRIELLRMKTLHAMREVTAEGVEAFALQVAEAWREVSPLVDWVSRRLAD